MKLKRIWVIFPDLKTGSLLREDNKRKGIIHENHQAVPISEIKGTFEIPKIKIKVSRSQFPMEVCFCMTSYKSQGQTLQAVIVDFKDAISKHGHFYVGVTRVKSSEGLFIRNFTPSQIQCREDVKKELQILRRNKKYNFSKTYLETKIWENSYEYKIAYLNINGFYHNLKNFENDLNLSSLDYICIAETKLDIYIDNDRINSELGNFEVLWREDICTSGNVAHMGMVILQNKWISVPKTRITYGTINLTSKKLQYSKLNILNEISVIFVYVNKTPGLLETQEIGKILKNEKATAILGDFNINPDKEDGYRKINELSNIMQMQQVNRESTRNNSTLDLIFRKEMKKLDFMPFIFQNLYSDHCTVGFRYCKDGIISNEYKEFQIRKQNKQFLEKSTIDEMAEEEIPTTKTEKSTKQEKKNVTNTSLEQNEGDIIVMQCPRDVARLSNMKKLLIGEWVDSNVINCYLYLISRDFSHVFTMDTFFNEQLNSRSFQIIDRQFKNINLFQYGLWMIPVNCNNSHWFLLTIDIRYMDEKKIEIKIYDSLGESETWKKVLAERRLKKFIHWKFQQVFQMKESLLEISMHDMHHQIPQQDNGIDCGVFAIMYAKYLAAGQSFTFQQEDMGKYRKNIYNEIKTAKLEDIIWDDEDELELPEDFIHNEKETKSEQYIHKKNKHDFTPPLNLGEKKKYKSKKINFDEKKSFNKDEYKRRRMFEPNSFNANNESLKIFKFVNPGGTNLCFSNAVTTILLNIQGMQDMFKEDIPILNQNEIFKVLKRLSQMPNNSTCSTKNLRKIVQEYCLRNHQNTRRFDNNQQFDAAEYCSSLLEHLLKEHLYIVNNIFGKNQETIFCMNADCNAADQVPSNEVNIVVLPLVGQTLLMCLNEYLTEHEIERNCPHCGSNSASQVTAFTQDPETIIFQLSRFKYSIEHSTTIKVHDEISIPTMINLPTGALYQIIGTINHYGRSADSGHYTAAIYNKGKNSYIICDDETTYEIDSIDESLSINVYLIIYQRQ